MLVKTLKVQDSAGWALSIVDGANESKVGGFCLKASPYGLLPGGGGRVLLDPEESNT